MTNARLSGPRNFATVNGLKIYYQLHGPEDKRPPVEAFLAAPA